MDREQIESTEQVEQVGRILERQSKAEDLNERLWRVLPIYERLAKEDKTIEGTMSLLEVLDKIELHLYGIDPLSEDQIKTIIEPYEESIAEQIEEEANTVTYLIQVKIETDLQTGKIKGVCVFDSLNSRDYIGSVTTRHIGVAVSDFLENYHKIGEVNI